jgi:hypothetical protein
MCLYNFLEFLEKVHVGIFYVVTYVLFSYKKVHDWYYCLILVYRNEHLKVVFFTVVMNDYVCELKFMKFYVDISLIFIMCLNNVSGVFSRMVR